MSNEFKNELKILIVSTCKTIKANVDWINTDRNTYYPCTKEVTFVPLNLWVSINPVAKVIPATKRKPDPINFVLVNSDISWF